MKNRRRGPRRLRGEGKEGKERRGGTMISRGSTLPSRCKQLLSNDTIFLGMLINAFDRVQKRPSFDEIGDARPRLRLRVSVCTSRATWFVQEEETQL